jgi:hypothetical protein
LLNLGGDSPAEVFDAIRGYPGLIVQTSVSEANVLESQRLGGHLLGATGAEWAVVTAGAAGAVAAGGSAPHPLRGRGLLGRPALRAISGLGDARLPRFGRRFRGFAL